MSYVEIGEVADFLDLTDNLDDPKLSRALDVACAEVDRYCGWGTNGFDQAAAVAAARTVEATDSHVVRFRDGGFWSAVGDVTVKTDDDDDGVFETTWTAGQFELVDISPSTPGFPTVQIRTTGDRLFPLKCKHAQRVEVTAKWGWESVPFEVEQSVVMRAAQLMRRSRTADGVNPLTGFRAGGRDRDWELLLSDLRHPSRVFPGWS